MIAVVTGEITYSNCEEALGLECKEALFQKLRNSLHMFDLAGILQWVKLIDNFEAEYEYVTNEGTVFTFKTNRHSPNYRLINIDFSDPEESKWKVLIPEHERDVLGKCLLCKSLPVLFF